MTTRPIIRLGREMRAMQSTLPALRRLGFTATATAVTIRIDALADVIVRLTARGSASR